MPIDWAFQRLKKPRKDGFPLLCNPSKIKGVQGMKI